MKRPASSAAPKSRPRNKQRPSFVRTRSDKKSSRSIGNDYVIAGMKRSIFFLFAIGFLTTVRPLAAEADAGLQSAGSFALGGIGVAGTMSTGERALREVLKKRDAVARLDRKSTRLN